MDRDELDRQQNTNRDAYSRVLPGAWAYETLRVFLLMKSIRMNCPNVIVFVK
jgi:hypothetical protein